MGSRREPFFRTLFFEPFFSNLFFRTFFFEPFFSNLFFRTSFFEPLFVRVTGAAGLLPVAGAFAEGGESEAGEFAGAFDEAGFG